jgi:hemolysin D
MNRLARHWNVFVESVKADTERRKTAIQVRDTDFLPAALEVLETPPKPLGRIVLWTLLSFVIIALLWAILGHIDVVASAQGKVIPRGRVKIIQAADIGVVREIHVVEGQQVRAGEPLIVLDPTTTDAEATQAKESMLVAQIDRARAKALVEGAGGGRTRFSAPVEMTKDFAALQENLVAARIAEHRTALQALQEERLQRQADLAMVSAEVHKLEQQIPLAESQLEGMEKLDKEGLVPRMKVSELKERVVGLRQDLVIRKEELAKDRAALAGVQSQIAKLESEFKAKSLDALNEAEANYRLRAEEVKKANDKASLTILTSPIDGTVARLSVHTLGAVVKPADALLVIVPKGEELIVEAMVLNKDIGFVTEGQPVEVKLEAFPFTRYGIVKGTVETVSRDAVEDEKQGLVFPAQVKLSQDFLDIGNTRFNLAPGLAATAEIKTDQRRIIEFLLSPLSKRLQEAGRER